MSEWETKVKELLGSRESLKGRLVRGGLGVLVLLVAAKILVLLTAMVLARLLGPAQYGAYSFAIAVVGLLAVPVELGLPALLMRLSALYHRREEYGLLKGLLIRANQTVLLFSFTVSMTGVLFVSLYPGAAEWVFREPLLWAFGLLPLVGLSALRMAVLRGLGRVVLAQMPESLVRPMAFLALLGFAWIFTGQGGVNSPGAVRISIVAGLIAFLLGTYFVWRILPPRVRTSTPRYLHREWVSSALPFLLVGGTHIVVKETDIVMLGLLATPEDVGVYRAAAQGALLLVFFLNVVNVAMAPHIARLYDGGEMRSLQRMAAAGARMALAWAVPLSLIFLFAGDFLLGLFFGGAYIRGHTALSILSLGQVVNAATGSAGFILGMTGHAWYSFSGVAAAALINVVLNLLLIPRFGIEGAAAASATGVIVWNVLQAAWVRRLTGITSTAFPLGKRKY